MSGPIVVGVAGGSSSGKTTVVRQIVSKLAPQTVTVVRHDAYYRDLSHLPKAQRALVNFDHPDALETDLLAQHLEVLRRGESVSLPRYDFTTHTRRPETTRADPTPVVIVDGILVLADADLRRLMDIRIFVDTDADLRLIRRLRRDTRERGRTVESVIQQYVATVRPMHLEFVEPSKRHADVIIPEGGDNRVAIDMVVARLHMLLAE
jgi:uridine kinase